MIYQQISVLDLCRNRFFTMLDKKSKQSLANRLNLERTMMKFILMLSISIASFMVYAGGNPDFVKFPANYKQDFSNYDTRNRNNGKQVAMMYANNIAIESAKSGELAPGSKIIMEVYKLKLDDNGEPIKGKDGIFEKGKHAAVAVMEKRTDWDSAFPGTDRAGNWGFAIYNTDGTPKENNLECATCHVPYEKTNYMFSFDSLTQFVNGN